MRGATPLLVLLLCGCALTDKVFHRDSASEQRAAALLRLQLNVMRFADQYTATIVEPLRQFQLTTTNPAERLAAQSWKVSQATAAYTIATGPDPQVNAIDMVVFATLSRMVIDDVWVRQRYDVRAAPLQRAHAEMEQMAWQSVSEVLTPSQIDELHRLIDDWRARNPTALSVAYIHFDAFAESIGRPTTGKSITPGSLFSFVGLDPLSGLDPAVRELTQTRQLGERALYFAERTPNLIDMQVQLAALQTVTIPEVAGLLQDASRTSQAAQHVGEFADRLPGLLERERIAALDQLSGLLDTREGRLRGVLDELRQTLTAGTATASALNEAIASFDRLMKTFDQPPPAGKPPGRPFDITEYTATAEAIGTTTRQLEQLLQRIDANGGALEAVSAQASTRAQALIDHLYWRLLELGLAIIGATLLCALIYRAVVRRWRPS
jgi:hypothetical protein